MLNVEVLSISAFSIGHLAFNIGSMPVLGLHHVTATVDDAQDDLDFCRGALGLRLVKKTVNFDNHHVYHFYYGNERGTPGTIWTTFPYGGRGVAEGMKGAGQVTVTSLSVPTGALEFWRTRLNHKGDCGGGRRAAIRGACDSFLRQFRSGVRAGRDRPRRSVAVGRGGFRGRHGDSRAAQRHDDRARTPTRRSS